MPQAQWGVGGASGSRAYNLYGKDEDNEEVACSGSQRGGGAVALARSELGSVQQLPRGSHAGEGHAEQEDGVGQAVFLLSMSFACVTDRKSTRLNSSHL